MNYLLKLFSIFLIFAHLYTFGSAIEIKFYNVGQANLVAIKKDKNSLIIDCGGVNPKPQINSVLEFLKETHVSFVITHQHIDHYSMLKSIVKTISEEKRGEIFVGGPKLKTRSDFDDLQKVHFVTVGKNANITDNNGKVIENKKNNNEEILGGLLGNEVKIKLLLPNEPLKDKGPHFQNLILKINYAKNSILFPGDANGALIEQIAKDNVSAFSDLTAILFPHHGSESNGELKLFEKISNPNILSIISSSPDKKNKIPNENFIESTLFKTMKTSENAICVPHQIEFFNKKINKKIEQTVEIPLFITSRAKQYYQISIYDSGLLKLTDGDLPDTLFMDYQKCDMFTSVRYFLKDVSKFYLETKISILCSSKNKDIQNIITKIQFEIDKNSSFINYIKDKSLSFSDELSFEHEEDEL